MRKFLLLFLGLSTGFNLLAQSLSSIKGTYLGKWNKRSLRMCKFRFKKPNFTATTTADGTFELSNVPKGEYVLKLSKAGLKICIFPLV
jgi:hypothetical protein